MANFSIEFNTSAEQDTRIQAAYGFTGTPQEILAQVKNRIKQMFIEEVKILEQQNAMAAARAAAAELEGI